MKSIKIPKKESKKLAEFIGILFGDGYIGEYDRNKYLIEIAGNSITDFDYHTKYIKNLIKNLFDLKPNFRIRKDQNTLYTQIISKRIFKFLESKGMPKGRKIKLNVPKWIKENPKYFISFTRGLFDTDGSLILRSNNQNSISLVSKNYELIYEVKKFLEKLDYFITYNKEKKNDKRGFTSITHCIRINRKKLINKFINDIGFSNPYKIKRTKKIKNGNRGI